MGNVLLWAFWDAVVKTIIFIFLPFFIFVLLYYLRRLKSRKKDILFVFYQEEKKQINFYRLHMIKINERLFNSYKKLTYWGNSEERNYLKNSSHSDLSLGYQLKKTFLEDEEKAEIFQTKHYVEVGSLFSPCLTPYLLFPVEYCTWGIPSSQDKFPYI